MSWIDTLDGNRFLKTLFPEGDPSLDAIRLHEIQLHQDGPAVSLRFDLNEYPAQPPAKWQTAKSNTVQIHLTGIGIQELLIRGWTSNNIGRLVIRDSTSTIEVAFDADECRVAAAFDHLYVNGVTAYRSPPEGSPDQGSFPGGPEGSPAD